MRVLNLYAGVGGNRKLWKGCNVTAVEYDPKIAAVYQKLYPDDTVLVEDAHDYVLHHAGEYDFIWASPPCTSHSRMIRSGRNRKPRHVDLNSLYGLILFLEHDFGGLWCVENVVPFYKKKLLMSPRIKIGRHLFWANFTITPFEPPHFHDFINRQNLDARESLMAWLGIHFEEKLYVGDNHCPTQVLRNCLHPLTGEHIFKCASGSATPSNKAQQELAL